MADPFKVAIAVYRDDNGPVVILGDCIQRAVAFFVSWQILRDTGRENVSVSVQKNGFLFLQGLWSLITVEVYLSLLYGDPYCSGSGLFIQRLICLRCVDCAGALRSGYKREAVLNLYPGRVELLEKQIEIFRKDGIGDGISRNDAAESCVGYHRFQIVDAVLRYGGEYYCVNLLNHLMAKPGFDKEFIRVIEGGFR